MDVGVRAPEEACALGDSSGVSQNLFLVGGATLCSSGVLEALMVFWKCYSCGSCPCEAAGPPRTSSFRSEISLNWCSSPIVSLLASSAVEYTGLLRSKPVCHCLSRAKLRKQTPTT